MSEWISVEDRLPMIGEEVLMTNGVMTAVGGITVDIHWYIAAIPPGVNEDVYVTHWMPLPEPPK